MYTSASKSGVFLWRNCHPMVSMSGRPQRAGLEHLLLENPCYLDNILAHFHRGFLIVREAPRSQEEGLSKFVVRSRVFTIPDRFQHPSPKNKYFMSSFLPWGLWLRFHSLCSLPWKKYGHRKSCFPLRHSLPINLTVLSLLDLFQIFLGGRGSYFSSQCPLCALNEDFSPPR